MDLLVVLGSVTPPGRLRRALDEAVERARVDDPIDVGLADLAEHPVSFADGREPGAFGDDTEAIVDLVAAADAVVLATPVYRGSMTGALKNLLDQLPVTALHDKTVGLVAMGGSDHHFLGAERHLRDVLAFFGAVVLPTAVYLTPANFADGVPGAQAEAALDSLFATAVSVSRSLRTRSGLGRSGALG